MSGRGWLAAGAQFEGYADATDDAVEATLQELGIEIHKMIVQKLSQPGSGNTYMRGGVEHTASAPGEPPAVDTGQYRASWQWSVVSDDKAVDIFTDQERGPALEFGTENMAPRPHIRPVADAAKAKVPEILVKHMVKAQAKVAAESLVFDILA